MYKFRKYCNSIKCYKYRGGAFYNCTSLESITIPSSVTSIGSSTFKGCTSLESIEIPSSVTSIGYSAFEGCTSLESITISSNVPKLEGVFNYNLKNIYYDGSIENWCNIKFEDYDSNPMKYASHFYMKDGNEEYKEVTNIEIPNTVTSIGQYQFSGCFSLESIIIPSSITSIGQSAFYKCSSIRSITLGFIPGGYLGYIFGASWHYNNENYVPYSLKEVIISEGCTSIGSYAFDDCDTLTSIIIPNSVTSIGKWAFEDCSNLEIIKIPSSVTHIGEHAFSGCRKLVILCEASTEPSEWIGNWEGSHASVYWNANEHNYVKIDDYVFDILNSTATIYEYKGYNTTIKIPSTIKHNDIEYIVTCVEGINNRGYSNTNLENVYYEGTIEDWCNIRFSNYTSNPMTYAKYIYMLDENKEYKEVTEIIIPETITKIGDYQFYNFSKVTSITIPLSVISIGSFAFSCCKSLTNITTLSSVKSIGKNAFSACLSLESIAVPSSVTSIGDEAFYNCNSLESISFEESSQLTSIGGFTFSGCTGLESIVIPSSVTSIGYYAFEECTSLTIYCEAYSKPSDWSNYWNNSNCPVVWGYKQSSN